MKTKFLKKVCVVGCGKWGKNHLSTLDVLGSLGGVVESDLDRLEVIKKKYSKIKFFNNLDDAIEFGFDGYVVATPAPTHFKIAKKIIQSKNHLLVEKPITTKLEDAIKLNKLAKKNNVNLMVGHILLFHPAFNKIKEIIKSNKIGKLQYIYSNRLNLGTIRTEENVLWSFAPHDFALLKYLIDDNPIEISCNGNDVLQPNVHDTTLTHLKYKNNIMAHIFVSWLHPYKEHRFVVIGSEGMVHFEDSIEDKPLMFYNKKIEWEGNYPKINKSMGKIIDYKKSSPLKNELVYFIKHLDGKKISICNGENAIDCMRSITLAAENLLEN